MDIDKDEELRPQVAVTTSETLETTTTRAPSGEPTETITKVMRKTKVTYSSTPLKSLAPDSDSTCFSPLGMAVSMINETARPAHDVQALLPDTRGIFHYHRPRAIGRLGGAIDINALARSLASRKASSMHVQRGSLEAQERAIQRVLRRISLAAPGLSHGGVGLPRPSDCILQMSRMRMLQEPVQSTSAIEEIDEDSSNMDRDTGEGSNMTQNTDDSQWMSEPDDSDDGLTSEVNDMVLRIKQRAAERRRGPGGVSKQAKARPKTSLASAYARYKTDEKAIRRTISEMGQGDADTILQMLRAGVSVDTADSIGRTALHIACSTGNTESVRLLLHMGANVDAADALGNTPLMLAATGARSDIVVPLLEAGADPRVGRGVMSAMAMVRSRLRMLRTQIRHARTVEKLAMASDSMIEHVRERRQRTAAVAKECVDIIRLLRHYTLRQDEANNSSNAAYDAYTVATGKTEPEILSDQSATQLDELSSQLMALGLAAGNSDASSGQSKGKMPETASTLDPSGLDPSAQQLPHSDYEPSSRAEDEMEQLLDRFAQLLGDDEQ
ncbi:hypothetical protein IW147_002816 [Coemansia sp. RSA 720]|nr:hypothetical protein IW147_002816 [Coemansia sp. RSA 720]